MHFKMKADQKCHRLLQVLLLCAAVLYLVQAASAQVPTATILGAVYDETGAVVPGATVTAKNVDTGITRSVVTGADGRYRIPQLGLGNFEVQVQVAGFETSVRSGITLTVGREAVVDMTLKVGAVTSTISVTGEAPLVETTTSSVSQLVDEASIAALPLNGRDIIQLAILQAGVTQFTTISTSTTGGPSKTKISIAGSRSNQSSYLLDGMDIMNNSAKGTAGISGDLLGLDGVREFAVMTSNYTAEYSRSAGGVINIVTKAGTNQLHGSAFEFMRNDNLDARKFFDDERPEFRRNQFGASLGGRIRRDKAFFFANYEGFREYIGETARPFVPTANAKLGILLTPTRNITPSPAIAPLLRLWPAPSPDGLLSTDGNAREFIKVVNIPTKENFVMGRVDYTLSSTDNLFVRYTFDDGNKLEPFPLLPVVAETSLRGQYTTIQWAKIIGNNVVNSARLGVNRTRWFGNTDGPVEEVRFYKTRPIGSVAVGSGISSIGGDASKPFNHPITIFDFADDVNYTRGDHALKFGFLGRKYQWGFQRDFQNNGNLTYTSWENFLRNTAQGFEGIGPGSADTRRHYRQKQFGWYIQDDYRVSSRLTLNLGLRHEFITNPTEITGTSSGIGSPARIAIVPGDWDATNPIYGLVVPNIFKDNPSRKNFAPRLGFAWDVFGNGKMALRGGWAYLYDQINPGIYENNRVPPIFLKLDIRPSSYPNPFAGVPDLLRALSPTAVDYYNKETPSVMQYNLALQRELKWDTMLNLAYVGSRSYHLVVASDVNVRVPDFGSQYPGGVYFPAGRPFMNPNWARTSVLEWAGQAFYNSLQVGVHKRFGQNFQARANYTWSRNVDDASATIGGDSGGSSRQRQNPWDKKGHRGLADMHVAHVFNTNFAMDLPFGAGRTGLAGKLLEGWQLQGILTARSGPPFSAGMGSFDRSRSGNNADRPNMKQGASNNPVKENWTWEQYYDPTAFELQPAGFYGNVGRNTLIGPGLLNVDFSIIKNTTIREGFTAQFRAEFFNLPNHVNFGLPSGTVFSSTAGGTISPNAGRISDTADARQIQFGVRLQF